MERTATEQLSDQDIIAGLIAGGITRQKTETKLYEQFAYMIKRGMSKHSITEDNAATAYSNTIIAVIKNIVTGSYESRGPVEHYIYRIFYNKCIDEQRSDWNYMVNKRKEETIDLLINKMPDKTGSIISSIIKKQQWSIITEKIKLLGKKCHDLLVLWGNHYSDQEIADIMKYRTARVARVTRVRCLEKMQKENAIINLRHE